MTWLAWAAPASAETGFAHLVIERPAQSFCPTNEAIAGDVEALAGHPVFTRDAGASTQVHCDISEHASGVTARIQVRAADGTALGTRELSAAPGECATLREPIAVVLLMLLDREAPPTEPSAPSVRSEPRKSLGFGGSFGAALGLLPRVDTGFGLVLMPQIRKRLTGRLDAGYWLPVTARTSEGSGGNFRGFSLGAALCGNVSRSSQGVGVSLCAGAQVTVLQARAQKLRMDHREAAALGQGYLALALSGRFGRSELVADLGPTFAFTRPRFYLLREDGTARDVHQPARLGAIFRLSLIIWAP